MTPTTKDQIDEAAEKYAELKTSGNHYKDFGLIEPAFTAGATWAYWQGVRDVVDFLCSDTMNGIGDDNWWQDHGHDGKDYAKEIQRKFGLPEGDK